MTTYNSAAVSDSVIAHQKGITLQQGRALRDNPLAIAEGASGAPRIQPKALDLFQAQMSLSTTNADATIAETGRLDIVLQLNNTAGSSHTVTMRLSDDGGSTWSSSANIFTAAASDRVSALVICDLIGGQYTAIGDVGSSSPYGSLTLPSGTVNAIRLATSNSSLTGQARVFCFGTST